VGDHRLAAVENNLKAIACSAETIQTPPIWLTGSAAILLTDRS
jgi:hypothetical protein